ncbi:MAG: hypothetical protein LBU32_27550 [Clostridiales bacterium]|nr:hypothetical protein [Clostridiales bacterium]
MEEILKAALPERRIKRIYSKPKTVAFANSNYIESGLDSEAEKPGKAA